MIYHFKLMLLIYMVYLWWWLFFPMWSTLYFAALQVGCFWLANVNMIYMSLLWRCLRLIYNTEQLSICMYTDMAIRNLWACVDIKIEEQRSNDWPLSTPLITLSVFWFCFIHWYTQISIGKNRLNLLHQVIIGI